LTTPARVAVLTGVPVSLAAVAVLSFEPQWALGEAVGWGHWAALFLPIAVIICELVSTIVYFSSPPGPARGSARTGCLFAIAVSYGLSATWHVLHPGEIHTAVILIVSAVPNVVAAIMLHTAMGLQFHPEPEEAEVPEPAPEPVGESTTEAPAEVPAEPEPVESPEAPPEAQPEPERPVTPRKARTSAKGQALNLLRGLPRDQWPSAAELAERFQRTDRWARGVLAEARA